MDHVWLRILITILYFVGGFGAAFAAVSHNFWMVAAMFVVFMSGIGLRLWMLDKGWV